MIRIYLLILCGVATFPTIGLAQSSETTAPAVFPNETIVLNRFGVYPRSITRNKGAFVLFIENRLPQKQQVYDVVLQGSSLAAATLTSGASDARTYRLIDLVPGVYEFSVRGISQTTVLLTITD